MAGVFSLSFKVPPSLKAVSVIHPLSWLMSSALPHDCLDWKLKEDARDEGRVPDALHSYASAGSAIFLHHLPAFSSVLPTQLMPSAVQGDLLNCLYYPATSMLQTPPHPHPLALGASLVAQMLKNLPAMQETQVQSLGLEDPLEKGMATHSSILVWRIPWTEEPGRLQSMGSQRVGWD